MENLLNSPESVALKLMEKIFSLEGKHLDTTEARKYLLDLYSECLKATTGKRENIS